MLPSSPQPLRRYRALVEPLPRRVDHPFFGRVLDGAANFFSSFCHTLGAAFLRVMSTIVLICGIFGAVAINMAGYYYLGMANPHPLIAALLYLPSLAVRSVAFSPCRSPASQRRLLWTP